MQCLLGFAPILILGLSATCLAEDGKSLDNPSSNKSSTSVDSGAGPKKEGLTKKGLAGGSGGASLGGGSSGNANGSRATSNNSNSLNAGQAGPGGTARTLSDQIRESATDMKPNTNGEIADLDGKQKTPK